MNRSLFAVGVGFAIALLVMPVVEDSSVVAQRFGGSNMPQIPRPSIPQTNFPQSRVPQPNFRPSVPRTNFQPITSPRTTPMPTYQPNVNFQPTRIPSSQPSSSSRYRFRSYRGLVRVGIFVVIALISLAVWAARQISGN